MMIRDFFKNHKTLVLSLLFFIAAFLIYGKTVKYDFVDFDDTALVVANYEYISDYRNIPSFFYRSVFNTANDFYYRPVLTLSFAADAMIMAKSPAAAHFTNVLLHFISAALLFILLRRLKFNEAFSFLFTAVFIVHPAFVQAVAWIPGRNDTLLMIFIMAMLILVSDYFNSQERRPRKLIVAAIVFLAALMTKETAAALFALIPIFMYVFCPAAKKKDYALVLGVMLAIVIAYMALRSYSVGNAQKMFTLDKYIAKTIHALKIYFSYMEYAVMPWRISIIPEKVPFDLFTGLSVLLFLIPAAASLFLGIGRKKVILFGLVWFTALLLPTLGLSINYWFSHRIYTASFGLLLIFLEFFDALSKKKPEAEKYLQLFLCLAVILFSIVSFVQADKFKNRVVFLANAVNEQPDSDVVRIELARYYVSIGDPQKGLEELEKISPKEGFRYTLKYYQNLGMVLAMLGRYDEAEEIFLMILDFFDDIEDVNFMLSELYFVTGRYGLSLERIEKLLLLQPDKGRYRLQYEKILAEMQKSSPESL